MKKFFTSMFAVVAAAIGMSASAQNMQFFVHGEQVNNGDRINITDYYVSSTNQFNPELRCIPAVSDEMSVSLDFYKNNTPVLDEDWEYGADLFVMFCPFGACFNVSPGNSLEKSSNVVADKEMDMQTEIMLMLGDLQEYDDLAIECEFSLTAVLDDEEFVMTFYVDKPSAGVEGIDADINAPAVYYDLQGRKIENPSKGLFIVKKGNKVTKEFIK